MTLTISATFYKTASFAQYDQINYKITQAWALALAPAQGPSPGYLVHVFLQ